MRESKTGPDSWPARGPPKDAMTIRRIVFGLLLPVVTAPPVRAVCVDWSASGRFADIDASDVIFEGIVERIEQDTSIDCAPDHVVFKVSRVWKGPRQAEYVLPQTTDRTHEVVIDGHTGVGGCPIWVEQDSFDAGRAYIVFASRHSGQLESMGCGLSSPPSAVTRKRLDAWSSKRRPGKPNAP